MVNGKLPRARKALFSDAAGTVVGSLMGTSTVTSYVESASVVAEGGRTGLANIVTAAFMIASLFFYPLVKMAGEGYKAAEGLFLYPVFAPALIVVGSMMLRTVVKVTWEDIAESLPAFLTMILIPTTFSITEGISAGFISYHLRLE